jgi:signal transduction histidine kinase
VGDEDTAFVAQLPYSGAALSAHELRALQAMTSALARASSAQEIIRIVVDQGAQATGSKRAAMWLRDSRLEALERVAANGLSPALQEACDRFWIDTELPTRAIEKAMGEGGFTCAVLPVLSGDVTGCVAFARERRFESDEQRFLSIIAHLCGQALERASLFESEQAARRASDVLYQLVNAMSRAKGKDEILGIALDTVQAALSIERIAVLTFDAEGVMRFDAWRGISEDYRKAVEGHSPWSPADLDPVPIGVTDIEESAELRPFLDAFRAERVRALAFVPLIHNRHAVGKIMIYSGEPRHFSEHELQVVLTVAEHVAQALARERAAVEREAALQAREEILRIVSHDLRTPLSAMTLTTATLLSTTDGHERRLAERLDRATHRMVALIDDLVDFGAAQAGRLRIRCAPWEAADIVARTVETFAPIAEQRGIRLESKSSRDRTLICDRDRAVQALSNLVSNALNVVDEGGSVVVAVEAREREILFSVRDTGPGIQPEEIPQLFDRYRRGNTVVYKGTGLGLAIAKGIVEAHGGRIGAENLPEKGAHFFFTLPVA